MKRGRASVADLAVVSINPGRAKSHPAPAELSDAQSAVWRTTVSAMRTEFITAACYPVMIEFCRHVCRARLLEAQISHFEIEWAKVEGGLERLDRMLAMAERETRSMTACARALRLTPHAQMHARTAGRLSRDAGSGKRPWD